MIKPSEINYTIEINNNAEVNPVRKDGALTPPFL
jgi:hypothetical protein